MRPFEQFDWTDERVATLRQLWAEDYSTALIGTKMGISKNAVIGKAHRLHLPSRTSPIRRGVPRPPKPPRVAPSRPPPAAAASRTRMPVVPTPTPTPTPTKAQAPSRSRVPFSRVGHPDDQCCWPIGEPGRAGFRFCEAAVEGRQPYCDEHSDRAYIRKPVREGRGESHARA